MPRRQRVSEEELRTLQSRVRIRDVAVLMYTSGTTAKPKGCLLTHEAIVRHGANVQRTKFLMTAEDRFWDPLPLFHIGGIVPMLGCLGLRAAFVHAGHFDPLVSLHQLQDERCTVAYPAFDLIWLAILDHPRYAEFDLSRLRVVQSITTPERLRDLQRRMPWAAFVTSFGATECSSNLTLGGADDSEQIRIETLGTVVPGKELKIVDPETGAERAPGETGELCLRGYARFEGYFKDPERTALAIDDEGWFHTGDLGSVDEGGYLRYAGRLKDMLKVGGENVAAIEIEDYLVRHPAVNIAQVVGVRDARYEEVPVGVHPARARADAGRGRADRVLRRQDRHLQGAAVRPLRDRVADVRDEDPEVRPHGADHGRARRARDRRGTENHNARLTLLSEAVGRAPPGELAERVVRGCRTGLCRRLRRRSRRRPDPSPGRSCSRLRQARRASPAGSAWVAVGYRRPAHR